MGGRLKFWAVVFSSRLRCEGHSHPETNVKAHMALLGEPDFVGPVLDFYDSLMERKGVEGLQGFGVLGIQGLNGALDKYRMPLV